MILELFAINVSAIFRILKRNSTRLMIFFFLKETVIFCVRIISLRHKRILCDSVMKVLLVLSIVMQFEKISIPTPWKVIGNSAGGGGVLKANVFKGNYETELEFPEGFF